MSDKRPVDLAAILALIERDREHGPTPDAKRCEECMAIRADLADRVPAMADEIEALREFKKSVEDYVYSSTPPDESALTRALEAVYS